MDAIQYFSDISVPLVAAGFLLGCTPAILGLLVGGVVYIIKLVSK